MEKNQRRDVKTNEKLQKVIKEIIEKNGNIFLQKNQQFK